MRRGVGAEAAGTRNATRAICSDLQARRQRATDYFLGQLIVRRPRKFGSERIAIWPAAERARGRARERTHSYSPRCAPL